MLRHALGAEIVAHRTDRQHQIIVADTMLAHDLAPILVADRRDQQLAILPVDPRHGAIEEAIAPGIAMAAVTHLVQIGVQRARRHFVQQGLPDMGAILLDQDDVEFFAPETGAQPGRQLQPPGAAAHHDDLGFARLGGRVGHGL
jgi:hypothetical protein